MPCDAMPCATQDLVQLATRCAATSLPWGFGIAQLFCDILVTVRAVQCKQVVCDDLCNIYVLIYLLINSLTQRGRQTLVPYVTAVLPFQALVSLSRLCKRPRGMES